MDELWVALITCHESQVIGVVLITGEGPSPKDGAGRSAAVATKTSGQHRLQRRERGQPIQHPGRPASDPHHEQGGDRRVPGWAVGGGHSLHVVCDMTLASKEHAMFKQTTPTWPALTADLLCVLGTSGGPKACLRDLLPRRVLQRPGSLRDGHGQCRGAARRVGAHRFCKAKEIMTKSPRRSRCSSLDSTHRRRAGGTASACG